jgi:hypothetical protein
MAITINGSGTVTGISTGGLPDGCIATADLADNAVTYAKIGSTEQGQLCKAWVNFNGTTASPSTIRASYNVSSVTKNGTGDYTVNFTTAMADANYSVTGTAGGGSANPNNYLTGPSTSTVMSTTQFRFQIRNDSASLVDSDTVMLHVIR